MYLGMDGTGVPMRAAELEGRAGKQPDGTAKTREVKLVTVWSAEGRDEEGTPVRDPGSVTYSAAIESAATRDTDEAPVGVRPARGPRGDAPRLRQAPRRAVLGDGAPWIWNLADEQFPGAVQIVDLFHAKQHLCGRGQGHLRRAAATSARVGHAAARRAGRGRARRRPRGAAGPCRQPTTRRASASSMSTRNRHRMRYPEFRAQGLCTSTGVVEAGCKVAIGTRLKRAGMHWTVAGADAIIALRCCKLSGRFEDFWERRSAPRPPAPDEVISQI